MLQVSGGLVSLLANASFRRCPTQASFWGSEALGFRVQFEPLHLGLVQAQSLKGMGNNNNNKTSQHTLDPNPPAKMLQPRLQVSGQDAPRGIGETGALRITYCTIFGAPYNNYSIMGPTTLLLRPLCFTISFRMVSAKTQQVLALFHVKGSLS